MINVEKDGGRNTHWTMLSSFSDACQIDLSRPFSTHSEVAIKYLFHSSGSNHCGPTTNSMVVFGACYLLMACVCYGMPVPSGLFVPGILSGAIYGRVAGIVVISSGLFVRHAALGTYALVSGAWLYECASAIVHCEVVGRVGLWGYVVMGLVGRGVGRV